MTKCPVCRSTRLIKTDTETRCKKCGYINTLRNQQISGAPKTFQFSSEVKK